MASIVICFLVQETETCKSAGDLFRKERTAASTWLTLSWILGRWQCFEKVQEEAHTIQRATVWFGEDDEEAQKERTPWFHPTSFLA